MTVTSHGQLHARRFRSEASTHLFTIGQSVQLRSRLGGSRSPDGIFQITATLPARGNSPQYRIRNDGELHERVTTQDDIVLASNAQSGTSLVERTFGHGQAKEAQQPGDQKAEAAGDVAGT